MNAKLRAYLELVRLPNLFTAAADSLGGFACNGGGPAQWHVGVALAAASMCLYAGGVALNDVCDADRDRAERPGPPIPAGRISRRAGLLAAVGFLIAGVALAALASATSALIAVGITTAIVLYDAVLKGTPAGPLTMGACRALNLAMGIAGASSTVAMFAIPPIVLMGLYVASVTLFARDEAGRSSPWRLALGACGVGVAIAGLLPLTLLSPQRDPSGAVLCTWALIFILSPARRAMRRPTPQSVQAAVKRFVLGIVLFDAVVAWLGAGWGGALCVGALLIPAVGFARMFRVT